MIKFRSSLPSSNTSVKRFLKLILRFSEQALRAPMPPIRVSPAFADHAFASLVDVRLQLPPSQNEISLLVNSPLVGNALTVLTPLEQVVG